MTSTIDTSARVKVKDYPVQGIVDQNPVQLALLSSAETEAISLVLQEHEALLAHFGYTLQG